MDEAATAMMPVQHSTPGVVMGTVGYMSPEQAQAKLSRQSILAPVAPVAPVSPFAPVGPVAPVLPVAPCAPVAPVSPFAPVGPYLAVTGLFLLGAGGALLLVRRVAAKRVPEVLCAILLILAAPLTLLTHERNKVWKDEMTFWADVVSKDPQSPRGQMNYGLEFMKRAQYVEAEARFREAERLAPFYNYAYINLGIDLASQGRAEDINFDCSKVI